MCDWGLIMVVHGHFINWDLFTCVDIWKTCKNEVCDLKELQLHIFFLLKHNIANRNCKMKLVTCIFIFGTVLFDNKRRVCIILYNSGTLTTLLSASNIHFSRCPTITIYSLPSSDPGPGRVMKLEAIHQNLKWNCWRVWNITIFIYFYVTRQNL